MRIRQLQFALLMMVFAVLGLMPSPGTMGIARGDLIMHLLGWMVGALSGRFAFPRMRTIALGAGLWAYSLAIELAQIAVPSRYFELLDLVANAGGVALGLMISAVVGHRDTTSSDGGTGG